MPSLRQGFNMKKILLISALSFALSNSAFANTEQAIAAYNAGDIAQATALLSHGDKNDYKTNLYLTKIALVNGELDDAEQHIKDAVKASPERGELHFEYAKVMAAQAEASSIFSKMGYAKKVLKGFTKAAKYSPENIKYRRSLMSFHLMAPGLAGGDKEEALNQALAIQSLDPLSGVTALMQVYTQTENTEKMAEIEQVALSTYSNEPEVHYQRGMIFLQQEDFQAAREHLSKATSLVANTERQLNAKHMAMYQLGRSSVLSKSHFDEGVAALTYYIDEVEVSGSMPDKSWAKFRLANLAEFQGNKTKAKTIYNEILQETSDSKLKKKAKKKVRKLS